MDIQRVFDIVLHQYQQYPKNTALSNKKNNKWLKYSISHFREDIDRLSLALLRYGIKKGDKIAILSNSCPQWNIVDIATQQIGVINVPIYPTSTTTDITYIFDHADVKLIFAENKVLADKAKAANQMLPVITFEKIHGYQYLREFMQLSTKSQQNLKDLSDKILPEDLVTIIYTSGTTGKPKGVMLSHNNLVHQVLSCFPLLPIQHGDKVLSFLPMSHVFERMLVYLYMYAGVTIYYAESIEKLGDNLKEVKPHFFTTVPRLLEKVYDKIQAKGNALTGIKKGLFRWAMKVGMDFTIENRSFSYNMKLAIANKLIFSKWREALGGNVKAIVSGSAALQPRLAKMFMAAKIPVLQGYGLTETSPVISVNQMDMTHHKLGSVGTLLEGVQIKIAPDGEILTKGPHIMMGYYNDIEKTAEVIDSEGWFHTGDIGNIDEQGFVHITDRKKDQFKTSGGKYIFPQLLENKFKESPLIEQMMVVGESRRFPGALIIPNFENLKAKCIEMGIDYTDDHEMIIDPTIQKIFQMEVDKFNQNFAQYEQIKRFELLSHLWTVESGELTPTMKCKRKVILTNYENYVEKIYVA